MNQFVHKMNEGDEEDEQMGTEEKKQDILDEGEELRKEIEKKDFGINEDNDE